MQGLAVLHMLQQAADLSHVKIRGAPFVQFSCPFSEALVPPHKRKHPVCFEAVYLDLCPEANCVACSSRHGQSSQSGIRKLLEIFGTLPCQASLCACQGAARLILDATCYAVELAPRRTVQCHLCFLNGMSDGNLAGMPESMRVVHCALHARPTQVAACLEKQIAPMCSQNLLKSAVALNLQLELEVSDYLASSSTAGEAQFCIDLGDNGNACTQSRHC